MRKTKPTLLSPFALLAIILIIILPVILTAIIFFSSDLRPSFIQNWKKYYSVEDWDLRKHAIVDIDSDGETDMITIPGWSGEPSAHCAFLSATNLDDIAEENRCEQPGMTLIIAPNEQKIGQKLESAHSFRYNWLRKSYLVKTQQDRWRFYDINGLQMRVFEKNELGIFEEVSPTFIDRIDTFTYQFSHLGIVGLLLSVRLFMRSF